jgi:hypothetical protein
MNYLSEAISSGLEKLAAQTQAGASAHPPGPSVASNFVQSIRAFSQAAGAAAPSQQPSSSGTAEKDLALPPAAKTDNASSSSSIGGADSEASRIARFKQELGASCINLHALKRHAFRGVPEKDNLRVVVWKVSARMECWPIP